MLETDNLNLPIYEMDDPANLADGYNNAMQKLDDAYQTNESRFPISSDNIEDGGINTVDIANGAITTNKLATAAVETDKIADGAVSLDKFAADIIDAQPTEGSENLVSSNGVYEFVQDQLQHIPTDITRKILWLGDSYSDPNTAAIDWVQNRVKPLVGATKIINNAKSGAFITTSSSTNNIYAQIPATPIEGITDVVIYAGHNDIANSPNNYSITPSLTGILQKLNQDYPEAKIHLFIPNTTASSTFEIRGIFQQILDAIGNAAVPNVYNYSFVYMYQQFWGGMAASSDGHPTATGLLGISKQVAQCILGHDKPLQTYYSPTAYAMDSAGATLQMVNNTICLQNATSLRFSNAVAKDADVYTFAEHTLVCSPSVIIPVFVQTSGQPWETHYWRLNRDVANNRMHITTIDPIAAGSNVVVPPNTITV